MHWHRRHSKTYVYTLRLIVFKLKFDQQTEWVFFNGGLESKTQFLKSYVIVQSQVVPDVTLNFSGGTVGSTDSVQAEPLAQEAQIQLRLGPWLRRLRFSSPFHCPKPLGGVLHVLSWSGGHPECRHYF